MEVTFVRNTLGGVNGGRTSVIRSTEGSKILYLTDHMIAPPTLMEAHLTLQNKHPHSLVRGPILPLDVSRINPTVPELHPPFHIPRFSFETNNTSFPKIGLAKVDGFDLQVDEENRDIEIYWRLLNENFQEIYAAEAYCYMDDSHCPKRSLQNARDNARVIARSAALYYMSHHTPKVAAAIGYSPTQRFCAALTANALTYRIYGSIVDINTQPHGIWLAPLAQRMFEHVYHRELSREIVERHL